MSYLTQLTESEWALSSFWRSFRVPGSYRWTDLFSRAQANKFLETTKGKGDKFESLWTSCVQCPDDLPGLVELQVKDPALALVSGGASSSRSLLGSRSEAGVDEGLGGVAVERESEDGSGLHPGPRVGPRTGISVTPTVGGHSHFGARKTPYLLTP